MARRGPRGQARPAALGRLPDDVDDAALRHRPARGDVVREARPRPRPTCTRSCTPSPPRSTRRGRPRATSSSSTCSPQKLLGPGAHPPRRPQGPRQRAAACTTPPARRRSPAGASVDWRATGRPGDARAGRCRSSSSSSATTPRSPTSSPRSGPLADTPRLHRQERHLPGRGGGRRASPAKNGVMLGGAGDGRPAIDTDEKMAEAILTLLRHDERRTSPCRASAPSRSGSARSSSTSPRARRRSGSPSPTPRSRRCRSSPRRSGRAPRPAAGATRPFTVNIERLKPFHTLTGRMHFYLDHDWMQRPRRGAADLPAAARHAPAVRRAASSGRTGPSRSPSATSRRTRSGRSTPSTRTTCSCSRSPAAARRCG